MDARAFLNEYRSEAYEHLRILDAQILRLERDPTDPRPVRQMFLSAHSIKGGAAMLGLAGVRTLAHAIEDVLACMRDEGLLLDGETADLLFRGLDALRGLLSTASLGADGPEPAVAELARALLRRSQSVRHTSPESAVSTLSQERPRALVVESSATQRLLQSELLREAGFQVDAVADGAQALAAANIKHYRLVVTALETSGMRGLELAEVLSAQPRTRDLPVILISSREDPDLRRRAAEAGVRAFIRKGSYRDQLLVQTAREFAAGKMS